MKRPNSPSILERRIDELISYCDQNDEPPMGFVTRARLGLTEAELDAMRRGDMGEGFKAAVERLDDYREYFWTRKGLRDPKLATFSTFNLKELKGGEDSERIKITVVTEGVGEGAFD